MPKPIRHFLELINMKGFDANGNSAKDKVPHPVWLFRLPKLSVPGEMKRIF